MSLGNLLEGKFIVYGTGDYGNKIFNHAKEIGETDRILYFVDRDEKKQNSTFMGYPVRSPEHILNDSEVPVVIALVFFESVCKSLRMMGIKNPLWIFGTARPAYPHSAVIYYGQEKFSQYFDMSDLLTLNTLNHIFKYRTQDNRLHVCPYEDTEGLETVQDYWYDDLHSLSRFDNVTFVDGGAYSGDSVERIARNNSNIKKIYAFEPDTDTFKALNSTIERLELNEISETFCMAIGNLDGYVSFSASSSIGSKISEEGSDIVKICRLDTLDLAVIGKLCIKLDIEGAEPDALNGARETIQAYKPELAVCVYHHYSDIYEVPKLIKEILPEYRLTLRGGRHLVCYATCE